MLLSQTVWASRGWKGAERLISLEDDQEGLEPAGTFSKTPDSPEILMPRAGPQHLLVYHRCR